MFAAFNILTKPSEEREEEIHTELEILLFRQGISEYEPKTAIAKEIYKLHHHTFDYLSKVHLMAKGVAGKRDVTWGWTLVYQWILDNKYELADGFETAVDGVVEADAQIEQAKRKLVQKGYEKHVRVKCSLEHGFEVIGVILQVLSGTLVEVLAEDSIYELHVSSIRLME